MSKYYNRKTEVDGIKFDSKKEARRYQELKIMERAKIITNLRLQPRYQLQERYTNGDGKKIREMSYVADFEYHDTVSGLLTVEDVKGMKTKEYLLKKKLFEKVYYPLTITEV